jgi:hypothetical protein
MDGELFWEEALGVDFVQLRALACSGAKRKYALLCGVDEAAIGTPVSELSVKKEEATLNWKEKTIALVVSLSSLLVLEGLELLDTHTTCNVRAGNVHRNRAVILNWAENLDEMMFVRQFRVCREDFNTLLHLIEADIEPDHKKAVNSSGSPIVTRLSLMITLRILAGASYLDMVHYHVHVDSVSTIVHRTVDALHKRLDNIQLPQTEIECRALAARWEEVQQTNWHHVVTPGTILAGDGYIALIERPTHADLHDRPVLPFMNRKHVWSLLCLAFCNADTRFAVFDIRWPGGVNDNVAYPFTDVYAKAMAGFFPSWATFVLDEAFSCFGGMHMTPHSIHQLRSAEATDFRRYMKMLAYDYILSSQRITVERSLGMLARRFGILWKPIRMKLARVAKVIRVCAMLHNVCVDRWVKRGRPTASEGPPLHVGVRYEVEASDAEVKSRISSSIAGQKGGQSAVKNDLREQFMTRIYDAGIRVDPNARKKIIFG